MVDTTYISDDCDLVSSNKKLFHAVSATELMYISNYHHHGIALLLGCELAC